MCLLIGDDWIFEVEVFNELAVLPVSLFAAAALLVPFVLQGSMPMLEQICAKCVSGESSIWRLCASVQCCECECVLVCVCDAYCVIWV